MNLYTTYTLLFLLGGNAYCGIELLYRARTHYSMFFCAGLSVIVLYYIFVQNSRINPLLFALISTAIITAFEFVFGLIFNMLLKMNIWDYSGVPLNILGQICLPFSAIWFVFGLIIYAIFRYIIPANTV